MKKFYLLLLTALLSLVSGTAFAAGLTVTVHVNDAAKATVEPYYFPGGTQASLTFDADNECEVEYPDGTYVGMRYLYVTPVTPEGSEPIYFTSYTVYDCDGEVVKSAAPNKSNRTGFTLPVEADGGRVEIVCDVVPAKNVTFYVEGDLAKFKVTTNKQDLAMALGEQSLELSADITSITIKPLGGLASLYKVLYNNVVKKVQVDGMEGTISYYYNIYNPADGDRIEIYTDYPNVDCTVSLECNEPDFVTNVYVDGEEVENVWPLTVKAGQQVIASGDSYNYTVNSLGIDDEVFEYTEYELGRVITADTKFMFDVTKIARPDNFVVYVQEPHGMDISNSQNLHGTLESGYHVVGLDGATENPICFIVKYAESTSQSAEAYIYVNDEALAEVNYQNNLTVNPGDVIKAYVGTTAPAVYTVSYSLEGLDAMPVVVKDMITPVVSPEGHSALPGTRVSVSAAEGQTISGVTVNGEAVEAVEGVYTFTVDADTQVVIAGEAAAQRLITIKANLPEGLYIRYADDYELAASVEGAVYDLDDYDAEFGEFMVIYPNSGYKILSFLYNGEEVVGNAEYDWGGNFFFPQIYAGDTFVFNLEEIEVVQGNLTVYVSGSQNTNGLYLAECTGMEFVADNLPEGYSNVEFTNLQTPLLFGVKGFENDMDNSNVFVYLNNEPIAFYYGWEIECVDGDVLKVYVADAAPESRLVAYKLDGLESDEVVITHDLNSVVEPGEHTVLNGTRVSIKAANEGANIKVTQDDNELPVVDGVYTFNVDKDSFLTISKVASGLENVTVGQGAQGVYNLQGIKLSNDTKHLPAGVYIVDGRKVYIRN